MFLQRIRDICKNGNSFMGSCGHVEIFGGSRDKKIIRGNILAGPNVLLGTLLRVVIAAGLEVRACGRGTMLYTDDHHSSHVISYTAIISIAIVIDTSMYWAWCVYTHRSNGVCVRPCCNNMLAFAVALLDFPSRLSYCSNELSLLRRPTVYIH